MRHWYLGLLGALVLAGCGPSYGGNPVKTPAELVQQQEKIADNTPQTNDDDSSPSDVTGDTGNDQKKKFDKDQAKAVLGQAARSAHTCVGVVSKDSPQGTGTVTLTFGHDGHVKKATIDAPFAGTDMGKCAINAMKAVIVPPYNGHEVTMDWKVDLSPGKKKGDSSE